MSDRLRYFCISFITVVFVSLFYGLMEYAFMDYRRVYNWSKEWFPQVYLRGISPYHFFYMFPLFLYLSLLPAIDLLFRKKKKAFLFLTIANLSSMVLLEDALFFVWRIVCPLPDDPAAGKWIEEGYWTTKIMGCFKVFGVIIPNWYPILAFISFSSYLLFYKFS